MPTPIWATACKTIEYYEQALAINREIGERRSNGLTYWNLGLACAKAGDLRRGAEMMQINEELIESHIRLPALGHEIARCNSGRQSPLPGSRTARMRMRARSNAVAKLPTYPQTQL